MIVEDGDAGFAMAVYGQLAARDGNLVLSPASLRVALAMAYAGARRETAAQLARVLRLPADSEAAHAMMAAQLAAWGVPTDGSPPSASVPLRVVNRVWLQRGMRAEAFFQRLVDSYRAPAGALDFSAAPELSRQAINRWIAEQTDGKIAELLPESAITTLTRLVLTNAVLFKATWASELAPALTRPESFTTAAGDKLEVPMMHGHGRYRVAEFDDGQLLELPYAGSSLVMDVILPWSPQGLPALERTLGEDLPRWLASLSTATVDLRLPRFRLKYEVRLKQPLEALGVTDAFADDRADFSAIGGDLYLSEVFHAAEIIVDEQGTEAAAATAVVFKTRSLPPPERVVEFRADRPFVFVIRDLDTGAIVFMGRVARPT